jgi:CHAT domain-containing protein
LRLSLFITLFAFTLSAFISADEPTSHLRDTLIDQSLQLEKRAEYPEARNLCNILLLFSKKTGDKIGTASGILISGILDRAADNMSAAMKNFQAALDVSQSIDYQKGVALALQNIAALKRDQGEYNECTTNAQKAMEIFQQLQDPKGIANILSILGDVAQARGDHEKALDLYQQSLKLRMDLGDPVDIGRSYTRLGTTESWLGNLDQSLEYSRKAEALFKQAGAKMDLAQIYNNQANQYVSQGRLSLGLEYYLKTEDIAQRVQSKRLRALAAINIGVIHEILGDYEMAMQYYKRAFTLYEATGMKTYSVVALSNIAGIHALEERYDQALEVYNRAMKRQELLGHKNSAASIRGDMAYVYDKKGDYKSALKFCEDSLSQLQEFKEKQEITQLTLFLATIQRDLKLYPDALKSAEQAKQFALEQGWDEVLWDAWLTEGKIYQDLGELDNAFHAYEESVRVIESFRMQIPETEMEAPYFLQSRTEPYYALIDLLITQNRIPEAFRYAEMSKARILLDVLHSGKSMITSNMSASEKQKEQSLRKQIAAMNTKYLDLKADVPSGAPQLSTVEAALHKARIDYESFRTNLYATHPELQIQRGEVDAASPGEMIKTMKQGTVILEYVVTENKTFLFTLGKGAHPNVQVHTINIPEKKLTDIVAKFQTQIATANLEFRGLSRELYDLLLKPAEADLKDHESAIIIPDQQLWNLPFQALQNSTDQYFLETHSISYSPSVTTLLQMTKSGETLNANPNLLAFGNPLLAKQSVQRIKSTREEPLYSPLPEAEKEVKEVAMLYGTNSETHVGSDAQEDRFKAEANKFDVIHIAAHGIFNDVDPMYSYIALARGETDDGLLEPWEILDLHLKGTLVVLSGCETGRGKISTGEGMIGFAWAFFVAGIPSTIVSQWKVDSESTTEFMKDFHFTWRQGNVSKSQSLREAALSLMAKKEYRHPYYWAAFILVGNPD